MSGEDDGDDAPVIELFRRTNDSPFPLTRDRDVKRHACRHLKTQYDPDERTIECVTCKKAIDPFTFLVELGKRWDSVVAQKKALMHEIETLERKRDERQKAYTKVSRAKEARAVCTTIDKSLVMKWLQEPGKTEKEYAKLGRWVAQQLRTVGGTGAMILIEVVDDTKETK